MSFNKILNKREKIMKFFSIQEIADMMGVSYYRVYYLANTHKIEPVIRKEKTIIFSEEQIPTLKNLLKLT